MPRKSVSGVGGTFAIDGIGAGPALLLAEAVGLVARDSATEIIVAGGADVLGVNVVDVAAEDLMGIVLRDGAPVPGANVSIVPKPGMVKQLSSTQRGMSVTDAEGQFVVPRLAYGKHTLSVVERSGSLGYADLLTTDVSHEPGSGKFWRLELGGSGADGDLEFEVWEGNVLLEDVTHLRLASRSGEARMLSAREGRFVTAAIGGVGEVVGVRRRGRLGRVLEPPIAFGVVSELAGGRARIDLALGEIRVQLSQERTWRSAPVAVVQTVDGRAMELGRSLPPLCRVMEAPGVYRFEFVPHEARIQLQCIDSHGGRRTKKVVYSGKGMPLIIME